MKNFLVVTVAYNPDQQIKDHLFLPEYDSLVVDNSTKLQPWLSQYCIEKNIAYINNKANLGIATALNIACQYAIKNNYSWVITMDQDSIITKEIIEKMLAFLSKYQDLYKIAIVSPRHILQQGRKIEVLDENLEYTEGLATMTSGNLLNLEVWQKINGFRDDLFIDMVDLDYYCRAMTKGYKIITLNQVCMKHFLGQIKIKRIFGRDIVIYNHDYRRKYYQMRNGLLVYMQYRKILPEIRCVARFLIGVLLSTLFEENKLKKIRFMFKGLIDFCRHRLGKLQEE